MAMNLDYRHCGQDETELAKAAASLESYLAELKNITSYDRPEGFILLPKDKELLKRIRESSISSDGVLLIGIGGSSFGAAAVAQALRPSNKLLVVDTVDPELMQHAQEILQVEYGLGKKYQVFIVSKSGTTLETVANY